MVMGWWWWWPHLPWGFFLNFSSTFISVHNNSPLPEPSPGYRPHSISSRHWKWSSAFLRVSKRATNCSGNHHPINILFLRISSDRFRSSYIWPIDSLSVGMQEQVTHFTPRWWEVYGWWLVGGEGTLPESVKWRKDRGGWVGATSSPISGCRAPCFHHLFFPLISVEVSNYLGCNISVMRGERTHNHTHVRNKHTPPHTPPLI